MKKKKGRGKSAPYGFTLVELIVSLVIIGLLSAIVINNAAIAVQTAKQRSSMANMRNAAVIVTYFQVEHNKFPQCTDEPGDIDMTTVGIWSSCFLKDVRPILVPPSPETLLQEFETKDSWQNELVYESDGNSYVIRCYGKNGKDDGPISPETRHQFDLDIYLENGVFTASPY